MPFATRCAGAGGATGDRLVNKAAVIIAVLATLPGGVTPVAAFHRPTPPIVRFTSSGDNGLPRPGGPGGRRLALVIDPSHLDPNGYFPPPTTFRFGPTSTYLVRQSWAPRDMVALGGVFNAGSPTVSTNGHAVAFNEDCSQFVCAPGDTGQQIFVWQFPSITQVTHDPSGTSVNPALDGQGGLLAFESRGDLTQTGMSGASQIFLATNPLVGGPILTQVTHGSGTSRNATLSSSGAMLVFESTSDDRGNDTGVSQIWLGDTRSGALMAITKGASSSGSPDISDDGRVVAFESTAAVAGDGHDTGVSQVFAQDTRTQALTQLTDDPAGCGGASADRARRDWRVTFVCHGTAFFQLLRAGQRFKLPIPDGGTAQAFVLRENFTIVSTTADLTGGAPVAMHPATGTTSGHELYLLNTFKLLPVLVNATSNTTTTAAALSTTSSTATVTQPPTTTTSATCSPTGAACIMNTDCCSGTCLVTNLCQ